MTLMMKKKKIFPEKKLGARDVSQPQRMLKFRARLADKTRGGGAAAAPLIAIVIDVSRVYLLIFLFS